MQQLKTLAESDVPWGLPVLCIAEFGRVVTHLRVLRPPSDLRTALDFIDRLLESPSVRLSADRDFGRFAEIAPQFI